MEPPVTTEAQGGNIGGAGLCVSGRRVSFVAELDRVGAPESGPVLEAQLSRREHAILRSNGVP